MFSRRGPSCHAYLKSGRTWETMRLMKNEWDVLIEYYSTDNAQVL